MKHLLALIVLTGMVIGCGSNNQAIIPTSTVAYSAKDKVPSGSPPKRSTPPPIPPPRK